MMRLGAAGERAVWMLSILLIGSKCSTAPGGMPR